MTHICCVDLTPLESFTVSTHPGATAGSPKKKFIDMLSSTLKKKKANNNHSTAIGMKVTLCSQPGRSFCSPSSKLGSTRKSDPQSLREIQCPESHGEADLSIRVITSPINKLSEYLTDDAVTQHRNKCFPAARRHHSEFDV